MTRLQGRGHCWRTFDPFRTAEAIGQARSTRCPHQREALYKLVSAAHWRSTDEVQKAAPKAKVLNGERVRFEIAGGDYRLVAAFDFRRQIVFVKFVGTHAEYDRIDALIVSQF